MNMEDRTYDESDAPDGFSLEAEQSREEDAAKSGITERVDEPEPHNDDLDDEEDSVEDDDAMEDDSDDEEVEGL